jgi:hypothetical protein
MIAFCQADKIGAMGEMLAKMMWRKLQNRACWRNQLGCAND